MYQEGYDNTISNVMIESTNLSLEELLKLGFIVTVSGEIPERPHPFAPDNEELRLEAQSIYDVTIPLRYKYTTVDRYNSNYWRVIINEEGKIVAKVFAKRGQYIAINH